MYARATKDDSDPGRAGIDLRNHLGLLVCYASYDKDDDVLGLVSCRSAALNERILLLF